MGQYNKSFSCLRCRERKVRCNRAVPCETCIRHGCPGQCSPYAPPPVSHEKVPIARLVPTADTGITVNASRNSRTRPGSSQPQLHNDRSQCSPGDVRQGRAKPAELVAGTIEALHDHLNIAAPGTGSQTSLTTPAFSSFGGQVSLKEKTEWLAYLASNVPPRSQCDLLVAYFFENVNWIYQAIHTPSFMMVYESLWYQNIGELDPIWLSLLFVVISQSALYMDPQIYEGSGSPGSNIRDRAHVWFRLSRQALHVGEYEYKPCFTQIQVFTQAQLYWYAVKAEEALNSALGQAIKCAQAIGLDKDYEQSTNALSEMRHRVWWEMCCSDIFQAFCLDRQPLIQVHLSQVPMPANCDDSDMTSTTIEPRPMDQPTRMSVQVIRVQIFKALGKLFVANSAASSSYESVCEVDSEVLRIIDNSPWYMSLSQIDSPPNASLPAVFEHLQWQHHIIHTALCVQRIRMYRPFLRTSFRYACWSKCIDAVESTFTVYHAIRRRTTEKIQHSQKMLVQSYQNFAAAVSIAMFLLVERPTLPSRILSDIEVVMQDLKHLVDINESIPVATEGRATLAKILNFYQLLHPGDGTDLVALEDALSAHNISALAQEVYNHMGGRVKALNYLGRKTQLETSEHGGATPEHDAGTQETMSSETSTYSPGPFLYDQFASIDVDFFQEEAFNPLSWMLENMAEELNGDAK